MVGHQVSFPLYENWLDNLVEVGGEWKWVMQPRHFPQNTSIKKTPPARSLDEIKQSVLNSSRVTEAILSESLSRPADVASVRAEAEEILDIMAHKYGITSVRTFGYAVSKIIHTLFDGIFVNASQVAKVKELCKENPVVFMPTHRTYLDFLLLSLICFEYEIPLPAIASGMDFMNSAFMGAVLRRSGAFFMRRSFGKDLLYWAVFSEYVQTHLVHSDRPVEFFVEATRSRVGKSLHPKYGLLQILIEPYLRGNVYDMTVVPVSMNYDKILEEKLYAYELLGFPKPKESTSGLFKARDILNESFGKCFITFGDPVSVRKYFGMSLHRSSFVCQPDSQFVLEEGARKAIQRFGHFIVKENTDNSIITIWPLACMVMLKQLDADDGRAFRYYRLHQNVNALLVLLNRLGVTVTVSGSIDADLRYYLELHKDLFLPMSMTGDFDLQLKDLPVAQAGTVDRSIMERAVSRLILTTYANVMIHSVVTTGYVAAIVLQLGIFDVSQIQEEFTYLLHVLKREFVFVPGDEEKLFLEALKSLEKSKIIAVSGKTLEILDSNSINTLKDIISPYLVQFTLVLSTLLNSSGDLMTIPQTLQASQKEIVRRYEQPKNQSVRLSFLSTEPIKNTFLTMVDRKVIQKQGNTFTKNESLLREVFNRMNQYTNVEDSQSLANYKL